MLKNIVLDLEPRITFNHHPNLPSSFRALLIGASGCGKTCLLLQMLLEPGFIDYNNLIIFTTTPQQQEYQLIKHGFENNLTKESIASIVLNQHQFKGIPIPQLMKKYAELHTQSGGITITLTDKINELIPPDKLSKTKKHLIVFDDCITTTNQNNLSTYFNKGRHNSCNSIYLSQSYFDLDRMIRLNSNVFILFKLNQRNKVDIYNSIIGSIMDKQKFYSLADNTWSSKHSYIAINRESEAVITDIFEEVDQRESDDEH
jgi:hypothetical protein